MNFYSIYYKIVSIILCIFFNIQKSEFYIMFIVLLQIK